MHHVNKIRMEQSGKPSEWVPLWVMLQYRVHLWKADQDLWDVPITSWPYLLYSTFLRAKCFAMSNGDVTPYQD